MLLSVAERSVTQVFQAHTDCTDGVLLHGFISKHISHNIRGREGGGHDEDYQICQSLQKNRGRSAQSLSHVRFQSVLKNTVTEQVTM